MKSLARLKNFEKKIYQTVFQDGIYDLTWGLLMLAIAVNPVLLETTGIPRSLLFMGELLLAGSWLLLGKEFITRPRFGAMVPAIQRQRTGRRVLISGGVLFILVMLMVLLRISGILQMGPDPLMVSLIFLILFTVLSLVISYNMLFVIGLLFALSIPVSELLYPLVGEPLDSLISFGLSALIVLGIGLFRLVRFVKRYPVETEDMNQ